MAELQDTPNLSALYRSCWARLRTAAELGSGGGWRIPVLGTLRGGRPRQRCVVLRRVDEERGLLWIHTDLRSGKVADICQDSRVSLLFYDSTTETQLWIGGSARVLTDGAEVDWLWEHSAASSLRMYLAPGAPGSAAEPGDCNLPESVRGRIPEVSELSAGRVNFAGVAVEAVEFEWLQLARSGNQRAVFERISANVVHERWVLP